MKKFGTINGLFLGLISIFGAFLVEGGSFKALFLLPAMLIVFGGTFSAVIIGFGLDNFLRIFKLIKKAYFPVSYNLTKMINDFTEIAIELRKNGILAIEKELDRFDHYFPKKILKMLIDGSEPEEIESLSQTEISSMQERHFANVFIFTKMGGYAPTMGIIGTVMGLIMSLANAGGNPEELIRNIASAFIATLWGIFSANIIWLPIGDKLKQCHLEEKHMMEMASEGVLALRNGEIPSVIKMRLTSMLSQRDQERILNAV